MILRDDKERLCGCLLLKTSDSSWLQKLFILDEDNCLLRYFQEETKLPEELMTVKDLWDEHDGEINLRLITKIEDRSKTEALENCFEIETCETKFLLQAESKEDMDGWIKALRKTVMDPSRRKEGGSHSHSWSGPLNRQNGSFQRSYSAPDRDVEKQTTEHISYETKVVGGVVVRTPVRKTDPAGDGMATSHDSKQRHRSESDGYNASGIRVVKEGYCIKKGAVVKNWKKRYFKLDLMKLTYYEREKDKDPLRIVPTKDISKVRESLSSEGHREHLFEVVTPSRTFLIQKLTVMAESSTEMLSWINAFNEVLTSLRGRPSSSGRGTRASFKRRSIRDSYAFSTML